MFVHSRRNEVVKATHCAKLGIRRTSFWVLGVKLPWNLNKHMEGEQDILLGCIMRCRPHLVSHKQ